MDYEVAICHDEAARFVVAKDVELVDLYSTIKVALARIEEGSTPHAKWKTPAVLVSRMDSTPDALREKWEAAFYDVDKNGHRRRRYKRLQIEKDYEAMLKKDRAEARQARADTNIHMGKEA